MTMRKKNAAPTSASESIIEKLTYEQALEELESIVAALEAGENSLEASLALYERGQALSKHCTQILDKAELKIRQLTKDELPPPTGDISDG